MAKKTKAVVEGVDEVIEAAFEKPSAPADMTPEESAALQAKFERLEQIEGHIRAAPNNEQYQQERNALRRELGID